MKYKLSQRDFILINTLGELRDNEQNSFDNITPVCAQRLLDLDQKLSNTQLTSFMELTEPEKKKLKIIIGQSSSLTSCH